MASTTREWSNHILSGASSGLVSAVALQPLDLLKTRVQQQGGNSSFPAFVNTVRGIIARDGSKGLWRGTLPTVYRNVPGVALYFSMLQRVRSTMTSVPYLASTSQSSPSGVSTLPKLSAKANLAAGAFSRVAVGFLLNPLTVVKARFESDVYAYRSMLDAFRGIVQTSGPLGLMQGFTASALRDAPYAGLFVMSYEITKEQTSRIFKPQTAAGSGLLLSASGAIAATLATVATHPFDTLKTVMQVHPTRYPTLFKAATLLVRERGLLGYFDGVTLRLGKKVASSAVSWTVYETLLIALKS